MNLHLCESPIQSNDDDKCNGSDEKIGTEWDDIYSFGLDFGSFIQNNSINARMVCSSYSHWYTEI